MAPNKGPLYDTSTTGILKLIFVNPLPSSSSAMPSSFSLFPVLRSACEYIVVQDGFSVRGGTGGKIGSGCCGDRPVVVGERLRRGRGERTLVGERFVRAGGGTALVEDLRSCCSGSGGF